MPAWRVRDFHDDDLDQAIHIWNQTREGGEPVFSAAEVVSIARAGHPALVAVVQQDVVGMAAAKVEGDSAWLALFALDARWRNRGIGSALLAELEKKLRGLGVHRITSLVSEGAAGFRAMVNSGYRPRTDLTYFEKVEELDPAELDEVEEIAGTRSTYAAGPAHGVTNELLKLIPGFREHDHRLLVCATNAVGSLDPAWRATTSISICLCSEPNCSPRRTSSSPRARAPRPRSSATCCTRTELATTDEYLKAIADARPTLTAEVIAEFEQDIDTYTRL
ncbi:GNAT family N-acetyltransferase [Saccharopolyspora spinosa]|uniref:ATPase family protein associated with various cellular activities (AAA) n=1 Tax=Saccharopolyspora spinosa TaxID=60894 RepID=A0A2N3XZ92_SACSN|nr:GNAT family N-acetyltransferase [Saccharopolyspora spinosa]PKW15978.1 ATPase family protein associated with various cellular activities (AAA) [Saccharopolyspora spinosa]